MENQKNHKPVELRLSVPPPQETTAAQIPFKKKKRSNLFHVTSAMPKKPKPNSPKVKLYRVGPTTSGARPKKPEPNAPKITRPCTECGRKFWSWKALFGHMRCHPERQWRGINPPPAKILPPETSQCGSRAVAVMEEENCEVAASLLMLANGPARPSLEIEKQRVSHISVNPIVSRINPDYGVITNSRYNVGSNSTSVNPNISGTNPDANLRYNISGSSTSVKPKFSSTYPDYGFIANSGYTISSKNTCVNPHMISSTNPDFNLITNSGYNIISNTSVNPYISNTNPEYETITNPEDNIRFECSSCKKVFGSHQALGGHRASHKSVKGCFAIHQRSSGDMAEGGDDDVAEKEGEMAVVGSGHKCGVCLRVFSSGQALGGHMRCHFEKMGPNCLDLNLPAPIENYNDFDHSLSSFSSGLALDLRLGI